MKAERGIQLVLGVCAVLYVMHVATAGVGAPHRAAPAPNAISAAVLQADVNAMPKAVATAMGDVEAVGDGGGEAPTLEDVEAGVVEFATPEPQAPVTEEELASVEDEAEEFEEEQAKLQEASQPAPPTPSAVPVSLPTATAVPLPSLVPAAAIPPAKPPGFVTEAFQCGARDMLRRFKADVLDNRPSYLEVYRGWHTRGASLRAGQPITVATYLTPDRMPNLVRLVKLWRGPVSACIHLCNPVDLAEVQRQLMTVPELRAYVTAHLLIGNTEHVPINTMRNIAIEGVATNWVFVLDVDSAPNAPMGQVAADLLKARVEAEDTLYVMPCFRFRAKVDSNGVDPMFAKYLQMWPVPKASIVELWRKGRVVPQAVKAANASAIQLPRWMGASIAYGVPYHARYEPLYIARTAAIRAVPYDERFIGYGTNKVSHAFELWAAGWRFVALPESWGLETLNPTPRTKDPLSDIKTAQFMLEVADTYGRACAVDADCWWQGEAKATVEAFPLEDTQARFPLTILPPLPSPSPPPPVASCSAMSALLNDRHTVKHLEGRVYDLSVVMNYRVPGTERLAQATPRPIPRPQHLQRLVPAVLAALGGSVPDITLTTQLTMNRLPMLIAMASKWRGPISAAVHVCDTQDLDAVTRAWEDTPELYEYVRLHVLVGRSTFIPINTLRNVAMNGSLDDAWVFVVDVDASPSGDAASFNQDAFEAVLDTAAKGHRMFKTAYAVPAFAFTSDKGMPYWKAKTLSGASPDPASKPELQNLYDNNYLQQMHARLRGYRLDFPKWFNSTRSTAVPYLNKAEQYFIARKADAIRFDERFVGRGLNKVQLAFAMYWAGWEWQALGNSWVVDTPHAVQAGVSNQRHDPMNPVKLRDFLVSLFDQYHVSCPLGIECWWESMARSWIQSLEFYERSLRRKGWQLDGTFVQPSTDASKKRTSAL